MSRPKHFPKSSATLSRRELLGLVLGAPLAAQACRKPRSNLPGSIVGASMKLGHRLRDATIERAAAGPITRTRVAIVGAGPAGLTAAWWLERMGERNFVVFDLETQPGGTSAYASDGIVPYPWGAHYVPMPGPENRALLELLAEVGAVSETADGFRAAETARVREPEERLFIDGSWHEGLYPTAGANAADRHELARFEREIARWVGWRDARGARAFALPLGRSSTDAHVTELDRLSADAWLRQRGFQSQRLRWFVDYACRDDYGLTCEQTSAWAMLFYFAARIARPGAESAPFLTWPEGNGRLVQQLAKIAGRRLRLAALVTDIVPHEDHVELAIYDAKTGRLERHAADHVIVAVPRFVAARLLRPWRSNPLAHLDGFSYGAWLVANIHLRERPKSRGFPYAWDNVIYDSPSLGYVVATHQALSDHGSTIWTYYHPLTDEDPGESRRKLATFEHGDFCDAILADIGRAHEDLDRHIERIDVWRWGHAMVRPVPGFVWSSARRRAREPFGRAHFAHSDLSGLALFEEAHDHGLRAAREVLDALRSG